MAQAADLQVRAPKGNCHFDNEMRRYILSNIVMFYERYLTPVTLSSEQLKIIKFSLNKVKQENATTEHCLTSFQ